MKILVVDDSATMRRIISKNLNEAGYSNIVEAENGIDAMGKMGGVDLVVTDWNMPIMDGLTMVKEIKKNPGFANVRIVMVTSVGAQKDVVEALKIGVNNYVVKPFMPVTFIEKIKSVIEN